MLLLHETIIKLFVLCNQLGEYFWRIKANICVNLLCTSNVGMFALCE